MVGYRELSRRNIVSAVSRTAMSCFARATRASSTLFTTYGTMTAASRPMITTTTMISMRVNAPCVRGALLPSRNECVFHRRRACGVGGRIIANERSGPLYRFKSLLTSLNGDGFYGIALVLVCAVLLLPEMGGMQLAQHCVTNVWQSRAGSGGGSSRHTSCISISNIRCSTDGPGADVGPLRPRLTSADSGSIVSATFAAHRCGPVVSRHGRRLVRGCIRRAAWFMAAGTYAHVRRGDLDGWILVVFIV